MIVERDRDVLRFHVEVEGIIAAIAPDGTKTVVASGLPSYGGVGPVGILEDDGILTISVGGAAASTAGMMGVEVAPLPLENSIALIDSGSDNIAPIVELGYHHLIAGFPAPYDEGSMTRLATEVRPRLEEMVRA